MQVPVLTASIGRAFTMVGLRSFSLVAVFFFSVCGVVASVEKYEISPDVKKSTSRAMEPFMNVILAGGPQSSLFGSCLATSRTFDATFASIEVSPGYEYIRYVPDSFQMSRPTTWQTLGGSYPTIFDCAEVSKDGDWPMFQYNGANCKVINEVYDLDYQPMCDDNSDADAVFILSTADFSGALPRIYVGNTSSDKPTYAVVSKTLMTFDEAEAFCSNLYHVDEFVLFVNAYAPLQVPDFISKFISFQYTNTNLWTGAEEKDPSLSYLNNWYGSFSNPSFWTGGTIPTSPAGPTPMLAAYMDKDDTFKLRSAIKTFKAGALCTTYAVASSD